jgi:hypothetical protein
MFQSRLELVVPEGEGDRGVLIDRCGKGPPLPEVSDFISAEPCSENPKNLMQGGTAVF